jgi:DNA-binding transcriptional regulator YiaG
MTRAYHETYLSKAQSVLGDAFDYAVNTYGIPGNDFAKLFAASSVSRRMEKGEPSLIAGRSGVEVAVLVLLETTGHAPDAEPTGSVSRSGEYWVGWAVAYYQWHSDRSYQEIFSVLSFDDFLSMYPMLHEADVSKFTHIVDERTRVRLKDTNLKRLRTSYGCSQSELAKRSGVSLRSIQMYEQRRKDINRASADTLYQLSKVLGCAIEDLMERGQ